MEPAEVRTARDAAHSSLGSERSPCPRDFFVKGFFIRHLSNPKMISPLFRWAVEKASGRFEIDPVSNAIDTHVFTYAWHTVKSLEEIDSDMRFDNLSFHSFALVGVPIRTVARSVRRIRCTLSAERCTTKTREDSESITTAEVTAIEL